MSVFKSVTDTTPSEEFPILQALYQINNGTHRHLIEPLRKLIMEGNTEAYSEAKKKLPSFTPCGTFEGTRKAENIKTYSGFVILDIDKLTPEQVQQVKEKVMASPFTFSAFISPSGNGLKILVRVNSKPGEHAAAFNQLKALYEKEISVEIDKSGKDLSRLCFFSYDSKIYINEQSRVYMLTHETLSPVKPPQHSTFTTAPIGADVFEKCVQLTENKVQFSEGSRNNFVHLLANNCNRNGMSEADATTEIKARYNYNEVEVNAAIRSAYQNNQHEHGKYAQKDKTKTPMPDYSLNGAVPLRQLIERAKTEPAVPFVWSGIKKGSFGFVFGPSKSGKTTVCENLAMCLAAGIYDFLGIPITPDNYKVLIISLEEYWQQRTERNEKQAFPLTQNLGSDEWLDNLMVINEKVPRVIASEEDWFKIERLIASSKANFVIIDSLSRLYEGGIEESGLAKQVALKLRELTNRLQITLIVIHHCPKQCGKPLTIDSLAGSRMLAQEADFMVGVGKSPDGKRYIKEVAFRYKPENDESVMLFDIDGHQWIIPGAELPEAALLKEQDGRKDEHNPEMVFEFIHDKTLSPSGETHTAELITEFVTSGKISKQTLFNCLDRLVKGERIQKIGRGVYKSVTV